MKSINKNEELWSNISVEMLEKREEYDFDCVDCFCVECWDCFCFDCFCFDCFCYACFDMC